MAGAGTEIGQLCVSFQSALLANRRVAGVAAAARAARELIEHGAANVNIVIEDGGTLTQAAWLDVRRICGDTPVTVYGSEQTWMAIAPYPVPTTWEVLKATGKPSDGLIARVLNRPISRCCSALLLRVPGICPTHATLGTAAIALVMFISLAIGGPSGLIAGGLLFHAASVFDGVDGEIARATYQTTPAGAALDSAVDVMTNLLFVLGFTINLSVRDGSLATVLGSWSLGTLATGFWLIGRRNRRDKAPLRFEWLKQHVLHQSDGEPPSRLAGIGTFLTTRDSIAMFFMIMILAGQAMPALGVLALAATIWICVLVIALVSSARNDEKLARTGESGRAI